VATALLLLPAQHQHQLLLVLVPRLLVVLQAPLLLAAASPLLLQLPAQASAASQSPARLLARPRHPSYPACHLAQHHYPADSMRRGSA
jgi:hypothetical protein